MSRANPRLPALCLPAALGLLATSCLLAGCADTPGLRLQATVADDLLVVTVPYLATPTVDLDAGFPTGPGTASSTVGAADHNGTAAGPTGLGSFVAVAEVSVAEGGTVTPGQPLLRLDDRLLQAQLKLAEAGARVAKAQVAVLSDRIADTDQAEDDIADKRAELTDSIASLKQVRAQAEQAISTLAKKRADVTDAIGQLSARRNTLTEQRDQLETSRTTLTTQREQAQRALDELPEGAPSQDLQATIAALSAKLAELDRGLATMDAGLKKLDAGLAQAKTGLRKLDTGRRQATAGLTKLRTGLSKAADGLRALDEARQEVRDARSQLIQLRRLASVAAETSAVGVDLARADLQQATISAPAAGTVVDIVAAGDLLAPGAGLVTIRRSGAGTLTAWLSPAQADRVCPGSVAELSADWLTADHETTATLTRIAPRAEFPPTSVATDEVHLTRAFRVELETDDPLPAGLPVTVSLPSCQPAAGPNK